MTMLHPGHGECPLEGTVLPPPPKGRNPPHTHTLSASIGPSNVVGLGLSGELYCGDPTSMLMPPSARFTSLLATQRGALGAQTPPHLTRQMDGSFGQSTVMSGPSPLQYKDVG